MFNVDKLDPTRLTLHTADIYDDMRPSLRKFSRKYKIRNPNEFVEDFLADVYFILKKFDEKVLTLGIKVSDKVVPYDPAQHTKEQVYKTVRNYLTTCFINKFFKQHRKEKRTVEVEDIVTLADAMDFQASYFWSSLKCDSFNVEVSALIALISKDIERNDLSNNVENAQLAFLNSLKGFCVRLLESYGDISIFRNILSNDSRLSSDFLDVLYKGVCKEMCTQILVEQNPALLPTLGLLINPNNTGAMKKRIYRYFYRYKGGVAHRLGRQSEKTN